MNIEEMAGQISVALVLLWWIKSAREDLKDEKEKNLARQVKAETLAEKAIVVIALNNELAKAQSHEFEELRKEIQGEERG